ncbi:MAG TPA: hypothetical protein VGH99_03665 [Pseudonocardia sp.]
MFFPDPRRARTVSVRGRRARFAADLAGHPERYRAGGPPRLPFPDRHFDRVLSSQLLFSYADRLDPGFHRAAPRELLRVADGEVRVFPLVPMGLPDEYPELAWLRGRLADDGITTRLVDVA